MRNNEVYELIEKKDKEFLKEYLQGLTSKIESINAKNDRLSILLLLTMVSYFLIKNSYISNVSLGFVELNNSDIGLIAIPPIFSFLTLYYAIISVHRLEIYEASIILAKYLFKGDLESPAVETYSSDLVRLYLPFSMWVDIIRMNYTGTKYGCIPSILTLPLYIILIIPFWFLYYSVKVLIIDYWDKGIHVQVATVLTVWFFLYTIYFYMKYIKIILMRNISTSESKEDLNHRK